MNKKNIAIVVFILLISIGVWYFWSASEQVSKEVVETTNIEKPAVQKKADKNAQPAKKVAKLGRSESDPAPTEHELLKMITGIPKAKAMYRAGKASNIDVEFYGRLLDQYGSPVAGAKVGVDTLRWRILDAGGEHHDFTTDSEGYFVIDGISGIRFTIRNIEKEGYEPQGIKTFSAANPPKTSKDKPYIFHTWKKTEAEPLYYGEYKQKLQHSGVFEAINIPNLKNGLSVKFDLDPNGEPYKPENWVISLKANAGGIIESNNEVFMNLAPESGYKPVWSKAYVKGTEGFTDEGRKKFYFRSGNNYGRLEVNYVAYYKKGIAGILRIKYWINPNGSRNLQYDPSKRIYLK